MKKHLLIFVLLLAPFTLFGQTALDELCKKFEGREGFTIVNVTRDLLDMVANGDNAKMNIGGIDAKEMLSKVKGIKVLTCSKEKAGEKESSEFLIKIQIAIPFDKYKELLTLNEGTKVVKIVSKPDTKKDDGELIVFVNDENTITLVSILGSIELKNIGKLSKLMNLDGKKGKKGNKGE